MHWRLRAPGEREAAGSFGPDRCGKAEEGSGYRGAGIVHALGRATVLWSFVFLRRIERIPLMQLGWRRAFRYHESAFLKIAADGKTGGRQTNASLVVQINAFGDQNAEGGSITRQVNDL